MFTCFPPTILSKAKECTQCIVFIHYIFEMQVKEALTMNVETVQQIRVPLKYGIVIAYTELLSKHKVPLTEIHFHRVPLTECSFI